MNETLKGLQEVYESVMTQLEQLSPHDFENGIHIDITDDIREYVVSLEEAYEESVVDEYFKIGDVDIFINTGNGNWELGTVYQIYEGDDRYASEHYTDEIDHSLGYGDMIDDIANRSQLYRTDHKDFMDALIDTLRSAGISTLRVDEELPFVFEGDYRELLTKYSHLEYIIRKI